ncbi:MAG: UDPGP type 1 family protein [Planctomycetota bacterium]
MSSIQYDPASLCTMATAHGQGHLFNFFEELPEAGREKLLKQIASLEFSVVDRLIAQFIHGAGQLPCEGGKIEPAPVLTIPATPEEQQAEQAARTAGTAALREGRVGCFLVAGGQGTRLGIQGPKGAFKIGPVTERTLFQLHAEKILALRRRYQAPIPWLIMTSDANDAETCAFLLQNKCFGLGMDTVRIFKQANMPAVDPEGRILLQAKDEIALSPNGHGGAIKALHDAGLLHWLKRQGVDTLSYFQVDNVLVKIGDPVFIGHHVLARSQISTKVCRKRDWQEKVGLLCQRGGRLCVLEYSDLPDSLAQETDAAGALKYWAGSIAIHILDVGFVGELNRGGFQLPYHKAEKAVPCVGPDGNPAALQPGEKNAIKFETFIFDALPYAERTVVLETPRQEDFSPVKNPAGEDSPATAQRDLMELYARWLASAGTKVPRKKKDGTLNCRLEISPLTSLEGEGLEGKAPKRIKVGTDVVL